MNLHSIQQKLDKGLSKEYEKDRTVQHKKRRETLPKIASPAMMDICDAEFPDETSTVDMEEGVSNRKDNKNEKKMLREKRQNAQMTHSLLILRKV